MVWPERHAQWSSSFSTTLSAIDQYEGLEIGVINTRYGTYKMQLYLNILGAALSTLWNSKNNGSEASIWGIPLLCLYIKICYRRHFINNTRMRYRLNISRFSFAGKRLTSHNLSSCKDSRRHPERETLSSVRRFSFACISR